jgi:hypothetical protein
MNENRAVEVLAVHAEALAGQPGVMQQASMAEERGQLAPLFQLAEQLHQTMQPVQPAAAFVRSLGKELTINARRQIALTKRLRRATLIGAAALGSLLSIASVAGAIVFVVTRLRARDQARAARV